MIDCDDYFGGLTPDEYVKQTNKHFEDLEKLSKVDDFAAISMIREFGKWLFATESVTSKEADMLYHTILNWKEKADMYDGLCK